MKTQCIKVLTVLVFLAGVFSCSDPNNDLEIKKSDGQEKLDARKNAEEVLKYIKTLGFKAADIIEGENEFVVEGDIVFSKNMKVPSLADSSAKINQYYYGSLVGFTKRRSLKVAIDPSMSGQTNEILSAMQLWNLSGAGIYFDQPTQVGVFDILVTNVNLGSNVCGRGAWPSSGNPGSLVEVNQSVVQSHSSSQRIANIAHELGHCIGFTHTNEGGYEIPGFGGGDNQSLMLGGMCNQLPTSLSLKDKGATIALYPNLDPKNLNISTSYQFDLSWQLTQVAECTGLTVSYGGVTSNNFGGSVSLGASQRYFSIPSIDPNGTNPNVSNAYVSFSVTAHYSDGHQSTRSFSKTRVNGVWQ